MGENENESSTEVHSSNEMMRIPEITTEELLLQSTNSKNANPKTATESEQKTSKHMTTKREKW